MRVHERRSNRGFTLMEVMIAIGVLSLVAVMIMTLISQMGTRATFHSSKADYDNIFRAAQLLVLNDTTCKFALKRDAAGTPAFFKPGAGPWPPPLPLPTFPLDHITVVNPANPTVGATTMIAVNKNFSSRISVKKI